MINNNIEQSFFFEYGNFKSIQKNNILEQFHALKTKDDFLALMNAILHIEYGDIYKKKEFTKSQIAYFLARLAGNDDSIKNNPDKEIYYTFEIKKKSGQSRVINAPKEDLALLLHCIDILVKTIYKPHHKAFGFVEGKSIVDGAKMHVGKNYVYNIDVKDFFHSFDLNRVKMGFYNQPFNLKDDLEPIAYMIASLTTYKINGKRVLPQGSPASPSITNLLCWRLDHRLSGLAKRFGVDYTRYADDITFSSNHNCYKDKFITELKKILNAQGLSINPKKTRLQSNLIRQEVTGLTVNNKVNVTKKYLKDVRMYLYYCEQYGLAKAINIYEKDYREIKGENICKKPPSIELFLKGKLNYLSMVKGKDDPTYLKLESRFSKLFDNNLNYISSIIELWKSDGIDAAREKFYEDKKDKFENIKLNKLSKYLNEIKDQSIIDEKILITEKTTSFKLQELWKELFNINIPFEFFKNQYGWEFENEKEIELAHEKAIFTGNQILLDSVLNKPTIKIFLDNLKDEIEKSKAQDFLLDFIDKDIKGLLKSLDNKLAIEVLADKFNLFKTNLK
jgi:RNA-directed DNA polymerase